MKIIISHDVDHLWRNDHYIDLIYPKLWVRSTLELLKGEYGIKEWGYRMMSPFNKARHRIIEVMDFDKSNGIPSSFFFGMEKGLGMSYGYENAIEIIKIVDKAGFDVGVHGIAYDDFNEIEKERALFKKIVNRDDFGIRMHYVRFSEKTFEYLNKSGYLFDTTEFDKQNRDNCLKNPYKVGEMWEFPLNIMDGYLPKKIEDKKLETIRLIEQAEEKQIKYLTILFHDYQFSKGYETERKWYKWLIKYLKNKGYEFISYKDAIRELNEVLDGEE